MTESEILIIGANGQLGTALRARYPGARAVDSAELDITDRSAVENYDWSGITVIINAAAYTNVDGAETADGRLTAWGVNADAVANLTAVAAQQDATLVHLSSDYVFDGSQANHQEDEAFAPLSVYGATKAAGDLIVSLAPKYYIIRTSWVIGDGKNFVRTMLELGKKGISPTVVADQFGRLTFTSELVSAIDHLLNSQATFGTYNVSNSGDQANWADITRQIFELAGYHNLTVSDTSTADYFASKPNVAPRPLRSSLALDKIQATGFTSTDWQLALADYIKKEQV